MNYSNSACFILCLIILHLSSCGSQNPNNANSEEQPVSSESYGINKSASEQYPKNGSIEEPQQETRYCGASDLLVMWDDNDPTGTNIRALPNSKQGKIIATIQPSKFTEGCMFTIVEAQNGWFKIKGAIQGPGDDDLYLPNDEGWIHKSVISIATRNYGNQTIKMYDDANGNNVAGTINGEVNLRIQDLCGSWVKVEYNGKMGWVEQDNLCGIPWTNCI
jgi:hypothetical protein